MPTKLIARPCKTGGPASNYWELHILSSIVKEYQINESTNFLVEYGDYGITLFYAKIEPEMRSVGLGVKNFSPQIPAIAGGED